MKKFILKSIAATIAVGLFSNGLFAENALFTLKECTKMEKEAGSVAGMLRNLKVQDEEQRANEAKMREDRVTAFCAACKSEINTGAGYTADGFDIEFENAVRILTEGTAEEESRLNKRITKSEKYLFDACRMVAAYHVSQKLGAKHDSCAKSMIEEAFLVDGFEKKSHWLRYTMYTGLAGLFAVASYGALVRFNKKVHDDYNAFPWAQAWFNKRFAKEEAAA